MKDFYNISVYGKGYLGEGRFVKSIKRKHTKIYKTWCGMLERCYSLEYHKKHNTYINCTVHPDWYNYQIFAEWFEKNYIEGYTLDKDILLKGNKEYGPNTCCFVPQEINTLIIKCDKVRGEFPLGVRKRGNKFEARMSKNVKEIFVGSFETPLLAFKAYKQHKEDYIKEIAEKFKNKISSLAYQALIKYEIEITD